MAKPDLIENGDTLRDAVRFAFMKKALERHGMTPNRKLTNIHSIPRHPIE